MDPKLQSIFNRYDIDQSGSMSVSELGEALKEMGVEPSEQELQKILSEVDQDTSGDLCLEEFVLIFGLSKLRDVFDDMDADKSGSISTRELGLAMKKLGHTLSPNAIKTILKKVDTDGDGVVSFHEFSEFFKYVPAASLATIAKLWMAEVHMDCGSDIAPPVTSPNVPWYYGICGGIGGCISRTLTAPLEKVKLVAQTSSGRVSAINELSKTYHQLGFRGLFAGNASNCVRVFPYTGIVTYCYLNGLKLTPADDDFDSMEPLYRGTIAACSGIIGQLFTYPIDVVRTRMTVNPDKNKSINTTLKDIWKLEGIRGMYKGFVPTCAAVAPFLACQMATADAGKALAAEKGIEVDTPVMLLISGIAGISAQTIVYPLDVLRRRMQLQSSSGQASMNVISDSTWTALQQVVKREGIKTLFNGIVPTYAKVLPAVAIAMTTTKTLISVSKSLDV